MFVELHLLQNFAPSNLNRDDTGSPKDCEFGGYRRARISSQCLKRAIRTAFRMHDMIPAEFLAIRTKRLADRLVELLTAEGRRADEAARLVEVALGGMGLKVDQGKTQYLLFLGESELLAIAKLCNQHWDALTAVAETPPQSGSQASAKQAKKNAKEAVPAEVRQALERVLDGSRAADLALFGRMLADLPDKNVDAAAQVAHAISTNKVTMEFDFYTAVDDIKPEETAGADMLGTV
ncbi:MAG: type I-E CRISPR-associated protein Cas7/Cse4/CasC, partial [Chloroflexi bacterium]|nr:type I-E CRISPR-associated protein Cas7/Cse4/CasC [Chloroflexota bacterium]